MFLIDNYKKYNDGTLMHKEIINKLINSSNIKNKYYTDIAKIKSIKSMKNFIEYINDANEEKNFNNFPHILLYGPKEGNKNQLVNMLLEEIYDESVHNIKEVKYTIVGYGNSKTKVDIKQSNYHIIVEPNNNGFDKYLIQEIVQEYARRQMLNIFKTKRKFKIVLINCVDNLSYYAQASLRRTMEKYVNNCKFILISNQMSKVIEPLRSRCLCVRVPVPDNLAIYEVLFKITNKEKINMKYKEYYDIIKKSENDISKAVWLLELYKMNFHYKEYWKEYLLKMKTLIFKITVNITKATYLKYIAKIRNILYTIFITNIEPQTIIRELMIQILKSINSIDVKSKIICITAEYENRLSAGKRHIIHLEAYINNIINLLNNDLKCLE